ncbi:hypothetical protein [Aquimarina rubra]|uniref:Uncharacterized protein n=1 Tax=Aquimarina rubra TaxID=1920033 RepID=A0ABW5LMS5_9FLAO
MNLRIIIIISLIFLTELSFGQHTFDIPDFETKLDTIYDKHDSSFAIGSVVQNGDFKGHRFGYWKEYYSTGELKGSGLMLIEKYVQCCFSGPCTQHYSYKIGNWTYFYKNGSFKAKGTYETQIYNYPTSCRGGYDIIIQKVGSKWEFYDTEGEEIKKTKEIVNELETFYTSWGKHSG